MPHRLLTIILSCAVLSACAGDPWQQNNVEAQKRDAEARKQAERDAREQEFYISRGSADLDTFETMNQIDPSVRLFSLRGQPAYPLINKPLQPLSEKVIGEGYVATDPSVTVYPPRLPTAVPALAPMQGVRVDASTALYSAKIQNEARMNPRLDPPELPIEAVSMAELDMEDGQSATSDDMIGDGEDMIALPLSARKARGLQQPVPAVIGDDSLSAEDIMVQPLPPVEEVAVTSRATPASVPSTPPVTFKSAGSKSGPVNTGYGTPVQPVSPQPIPMPALPIGETVPMPPVPDQAGGQAQGATTSFSLTGY